MIEKTNEFTYTPPYPIKEGTYFLCLDTTGFQAEVSAIMMIGTACWTGGKIIIKQWLNHTGFEQQMLLEAFLREIQNGHTVITYYGGRFALPFIEKKCQEYHLANPLPAFVSDDYYEIIHPLRKILGLSSCRQAALENYIDYRRIIGLSGKKLVKTYQNYVKHPESSVAQSLLLHNQESLDVLLNLIPVFSYNDLFYGKIQNCHVDASDPDGFTIHFELPYAILKPLHYQDESIKLSVRDTIGCLHFSPDEANQIKHYFQNPKDYYYLPVEDRAVHKSLAAFVPKEYKKKADYHTCYEKITIDHPSLKQPDSLNQLITDTISYLLHTAK